MRKTAWLVAMSLALVAVSFGQSTTVPAGTTPQTGTPQTNQSTTPCSCPCANNTQTTGAAAPAASPTTTSTSTPSSTGTYGIGSQQTTSGSASVPESAPSGTTVYNDTQSTTTQTSQPSQTAQPSQPAQTTVPQTTVPQSTAQQEATPAPATPQSVPSHSSTTGTAGTAVQTPSSATAPTQSSDPVLGQRPEQPTRIPMARTVPVATEVHVTLDRALSSKTARVGDAFSTTLTEPLRNSSGTVLVPIGAKIRGEVSAAESGKVLPQLRGKGRLNLRFRDILLPDGTSLPITATLISIHDTKGTESNKAGTNEEGEVTGRTSGTTVAKDVGIGAGLGTVAGLIFGSALKGLAIGAIAGGGYVLAQGGKDVELPDNAGLRLRLDQNLTLPATSATSTVNQR